MTLPTEQAQVVYPGNGTVGPFAVPFPYLDKAHVKVYVNDIPIALTTDYTWPTAGTIQLVSATNLRILIRRETPQAVPLVTIASGSISPSDINLLINQSLYVEQELQDQLLSTARIAQGVPLAGLTQANWGTSGSMILSLDGTGTQLLATLSRGQVEAAVAGYLASAVPVVATSLFAGTVAAAKALLGAAIVVAAGTVMTVSGRAAPYDGYEGTFIHTPADTTTTFTADGLGFVDNQSRRWKRLPPVGGMCNVMWFGADNTGATDSYTALNNCAVAAHGGFPPWGAQSTVWLPPGTYQNNTQTLDWSGLSVVGAGDIASIIKRGATSVMTAVVKLDGATGGGAARMTYRGFQIDGNKAVNANACVNMLLTGNVIDNNFELLQLNNSKTGALLFSLSGGARPNVNTFKNVQCTVGDGYGVRVNAGTSLTFECCDFEIFAGTCVWVAGTDETPGRISFRYCDVEQSGSGASIDAVIFDGNCDCFEWYHCNIQDYGTSVATFTGNGLHLIAARRGLVVARDITPRAGTSIANHRKIKIEAACGANVVSGAGLVYGTDIEDLSAGVVYWNDSIGYEESFWSNNETIAASATKYFHLSGVGASSGVEAKRRTKMAGARTLEWLYCECATLPGGAEQWSVTVMLNGVATALISNLTNADGAINPVNVSVQVKPGDYLSIRVIASAGAVTIPIGDLLVTLGFRK